jgi:carboxyl-terminal processing protease
MESMSSRTRALVFLLSTPLVLFVVVGGLAGATRVAPVLPQSGFPHLKVFEEVASYITNAYVEEVNVDKVFDGAMRGLTDGLDASSAYLQPEEVQAIDAGTPLPDGQVGIVITKQFYLRVVGVRDGSPAARAGLETGDFIRAIDGAPTRDMSAFTGTRRLAGAPGSTVSLLVFRNNPADPKTIALTREATPAPGVTSRRLPQGVGYVRVTGFDASTAEAVQSAVGTLGDAAKRGLIIDLRGTADGTGPDGIAAARLFVASGTIATLAGRASSDRTVTTAQPGDGALTMPVELLVSNGTANAAEVFAAALADAHRARLVGEPTAGLAAEQKLVRLPEGRGLWLTYREYVRANGAPIEEHPLRPDVPVDTPVLDFDEARPATDAVLDAAMADLDRTPAERQGRGASRAGGPPATPPPDQAPAPRGGTLPPTAPQGR